MSLRALAQRLPPPLLKIARHLAHGVDPLFRLTYRPTHKVPGPIPPNALRARVGSPGMGWQSIRNYMDNGEEAARNLEHALTDLGRPFATWPSVLDFGCGAGRVSRWLISTDTQQRTLGCDVDRAAVKWAAKHLPHGAWAVSPYGPPLPSDDDAFDLIFSISVFSHFDRRLEDLWLRELHRVLRPGGVALLSTHGASAWKAAKEGGRDVSGSLVGDEIDL